MKDKGIVIPIPRKESKVNINESAGSGISFNIFVEENEFITVTEAAKMLGITKDQMKQLVEEQGIEKHCANEYRYLLLKRDIENL